MRISRLGTTLAVACALTLGACSTSDRDPSSNPTTPKDLPQGSSDLASTPPPTDLSDGGRCADGQDVTVGVDAATATITGDCGTVTIEGEGVTVDLAEADEVVVRGEGAIVDGDDWGTVSIEGPSIAIDAAEVDTVTIAGDDATVTVNEVDELTVDGNRAAVGADGIDRLTLNGNEATVSVAGEIETLSVHGDRNTVDWTGGATGPEVDEGDDNTFNR